MCIRDSRLERLGVGFDGVDLERLAETVLEEELRGGQPAAALLTLADALGAVVADQADRRHGRHRLAALEAAEAAHEAAPRERAAEPAGAQAQIGGVKDHPLEQVAVVLEV